MDNIKIKVSEEPQKILLGRKGETEVRTVEFDCSYLDSQYGTGTAILMAKRSQDADAYPIGADQQGNKLYWLITNADTAYTGQGKCELFWYVGEALAKSVVFSTYVENDIGGVGEEPPAPYEAWVNELEDMIARVEALETALQEMYERTIYIGDDGNFYVNND